jgi:nucleotide-binding universal stress UspA family protein
MDESIFQNIMIATDGSEAAKKAVNTAIKLAKLNNAKLYAVHVIAPGELSVNQRDPRDLEWKDSMKVYLEKQGGEVTAYVEELGKIAGVEVEPEVLEGNPADEIINFAQKNDIDLIIMGTLGKTGIQRFLLGSVTENVIRHSKKPVLVVRGETAEKKK